jgi:hypothetical protein
LCHLYSKTVAIAEQVLDRQADQLRSVSQKYDNANKLWAAAISNLENKIKVMKQEQTMLSLEAHGHANAVPELSKMVGAVQALVVQCEDLKLKYYEEMAKRKKLHNIVGRPKVQDCRELLYRSTPRIWAARMVFLCWRGHRLVLQAWPLQGVPAPLAGPSCPCSQGTTMTVAAIVVPTICKAVNVN